MQKINLLPVCKFLLSVGMPELDLPSLFPAFEALLPKPFFIEEVLHPFDHLHGLSLDPLQHHYVFLGLGSPDLDTVFQIKPHEGRKEGDDPLPHPTGQPPFDTDQDTYWPSGPLVHHKSQ